MPLLKIITVSTRPGRVGPAFSTWIHEQAERHGAFTSDIVDLAEWALPLMNEPAHPRLADYQHDHTKRWSACIAEADAFVFVMPEYNHSYTAPFKNAIDYLFNEWANKAAGFVSYGGTSAGLRAVQAAKPVLNAVGVMPVVAAVAVHLGPGVVADGTFAATDAHRSAAQAMLDDVARWDGALAPLRTSPT